MLQVQPQAKNSIRPISPILLQQRSFLLENPDSIIVHHTKWDGSSILAISDLVYGNFKRDPHKLAVLLNKRESSLDLPAFVNAVKNLITNVTGFGREVLITRTLERQAKADDQAQASSQVQVSDQASNKGKRRFSPTFADTRAKISLSSQEVTLTGAFYLASKASTMINTSPSIYSPITFDARTQQVVKFEAIFEVKVATRIIWLPLTHIMPVSKETKLARLQILKLLRGMLFTCPHCHTLLLLDPKDCVCHSCGADIVVTRY